MTGLPRLCELGAPVRLGLSALVLVLLGGLVASALHLHAHYRNRDETPGLSMDDFAGAYHGVVRLAPLLSSLESGHPDDLPAAARVTLLRWLRSDRIVEDYGSVDLGDLSPEEILDEHCLRCHSSQATEGNGVGKRILLDYFDDIKKNAVSREILPTPVEVLVASTHAHAIALATLSIVVAALALLTSWPPAIVGASIAVTGVALLLDMGAWWLARPAGSFVWLIVIAGVIYNAGTGGMLLGILVDLWRPARGKRTPMAAESRPAE